MTVGSDVSEPKRAGTELRLSETVLRGILESAPDAMAIVDQKGRLVRVNSQTVVYLSLEAASAALAAAGLRSESRRTRAASVRVRSGWGASTPPAI